MRDLEWTSGGRWRWWHNRYVAGKTQVLTALHTLAGRLSVERWWQSEVLVVSTQQAQNIKWVE